MGSNKLLTLAFVRSGSKLLLGYKKRGFGMGRWNGFGGKVQQGETVEEGARRELEEESSVVAEEMNKAGIVMFEFVGNPQLWEVHVFTVDKYRGTPSESDEMRPQWYSQDQIPYPNMWPDDIDWYPYMLKDKPFYAYYKFEGMDTILGSRLKVVDSVDSIVVPHEPVQL